MKIGLSIKSAVAVIAASFMMQNSANAQVNNRFENYFSVVAKDATSTPDEQGFIRQWTILEPISKPNQSNTPFTDSYLNEVFAKEYFKGQMTCLPKDGDKVKATFEKMELPKDFRMRMNPADIKITTGTETLKWHKIYSKKYNVKLMRFGEYLINRQYGVIYWVVTVINCENDMENVRLSVGSNSGSKWWINGEAKLLLSNDRRMVVDDSMTERITLKKGQNIIRGAIINGPGMSDFCVRIVDESGKPVTSGYTVK